MSTTRVGRNDPCPCGSGRKFKHCCHRTSFNGTLPHSRVVPEDGGSLHPGPEPPPGPVMRVAVDYAISDALGKAEVTFCYELGTPVIMADGGVLPVECLKPGMQFRLEDGGVATTTTVEEPKLWEPPSQERNEYGNSLRRIIGRVKYTGYFPRLDIGVPGDVIKTTPGHLFYSKTRGGWFPAETVEQGELLRNEQGLPVPVEYLSPVRWEFCDLYNVEVEELHTYFVGKDGIWSHNGMGMGCRVPRAATAGPSGKLSTAKYLANRWDKGTFTTVWKSIEYHLARHGRGLSAVEYTQRAMKAFGDAGARISRVTDRFFNRSVLRVISPEFGEGLFTLQGRVIWFHPRMP